MPAWLRVEHEHRSGTGLRERAAGDREADDPGPDHDQWERSDTVSEVVGGCDHCTR